MDKVVRHDVTPDGLLLTVRFLQARVQQISSVSGALARIPGHALQLLSMLLLQVHVSPPEWTELSRFSLLIKCDAFIYLRSSSFFLITPSFSL